MFVFTEFQFYNLEFMADIWYDSIYKSQKSVSVDFKM